LKQGLRHVYDKQPPKVKFGPYFLNKGRWHVGHNNEVALRVSVPTSDSE